MQQQLVLVTSGEAAGIGPDICLDLAFMPQFGKIATVIVLGDVLLLQKRATLLKKALEIVKIDIAKINNYTNKIGQLLVLDITCQEHDCIANLKVANAPYVLAQLDTAIKLCKDGVSNIIVTAPISKEIINQAGKNFSGHTEYFANSFGCHKVVMMLANKYLKVALLTTHLPLKDVPCQITKENLNQTLTIIVNTFQWQYGIAKPKIAVCGLNPHAGEGGYMGDEELLIINPVIQDWQRMGYAVSGSYPADTVFNQAQNFDVILAMYHDQGLPVLKYSSFETGVNITLGLPIIRTSVDHGIAINLAGSGLASSKSLVCAIEWALKSNGSYLSKGR